MRSWWGAIANLHTKMFDPPPQHQEVSPLGLAWPRQQNETPDSIFYVWEHTQSWYKIFEIDL